MKKILGYLLYFFLRFSLSLRYKIRVQGTADLKNFAKPGGVLFLANHPAEIDPCILLSVLWPSFKPHPVAVDYLFQIPLVGSLLDFAGALPVPLFEQGSNSYKKWIMDKTHENILSLLQRGEHVLIYPAGGLKESAEERIGGTSGIHTLLQRAPHTNIVLIRTKGLWGSSFSKAITGRSPNILRAFIEGFFILLKNGIFFTPRRKVEINISQAPLDFPYTGSRLEINRYLEKWFNQEGPEPLSLVPYYFWKKELPVPYESHPIADEIDLSSLSDAVRQEVTEFIAEIARKSPDMIKESDDLAKDLALDSLDQAQILFFLKENYALSTLQIHEVKTVKDVLAFAGHLKKSQEGEEGQERGQKFWGKESGRPIAAIPQGENLPQAFLYTAERMKGFLACADGIVGEVSYKKFRLSTILLAEWIRKQPGKNIGIMMPASVAANMLILAAQFAQKVPVMINWTLGPRNLQSILDDASITSLITSKSFVDRLENVDLNGLNEKIITLEEIVRKTGWKSKIHALQLSCTSAPRLAKYYKLSELKGDDTAVILFTSGTESLPKGVPLSHKNILTNQKDAYKFIAVEAQDVMVGILPPFHSFGFSITGLFPLLFGLRAIYSPNPADGRRIANLIEKWGGSILCSVPTFLKNLLRVATPHQLRSLRIVVTGAEKASLDLWEKLLTFNEKILFSEGYGITECSPILTINPFQGKKKGVGLPLDHVQICIVEPEKLTLQPTDKEGLILARGDSIFKGYLNPSLHSPFVSVEGKTWYNTGDLGYVDEDHYLTLSGRLKRFLKIGGEMVSLQAIETILLQAASQQGWNIAPDTQSLAIVAKEEEGKKGEVHLFATFPLTIENANLVLKEAGMSNLVRITKIHQIPSIPLLGSGKIDYKILNEKI